MISWTYQKTLDSGHLIGGPNLSFFRRNNKIRIVWETEHVLENGISIWTAKDGNFEMDYAEFIQKIKEFGLLFFAEMGNRIDLAVEKDWGKIKLDKRYLIKEYIQNKDWFYSLFILLEQETENKTNWSDIKTLFDRMTNEIK